MTPPNVIFIPSLVSGATYTLSGDLVYSTSVRFNITNLSESGQDADFTPYTSQPIRDDGNAIRFIIVINAWASVDAFVASGGFSDVKLIVNGSEFVEGSISYNSGSTQLLQIYLNEASSGDAAAFWSSMSNGDPFSLELYY